MPRFSLIISISVILAIFGGKSLTAKDNPATDSGIHAIGDGNLCVYGQNSTITQLFGAPYSSPSVFRLILSGNNEDKSERISGTAIWKHQILRQGVIISNQTDFISSQARTFVREIKSTAEVTYELTIKGESSNKIPNSVIIISAEKGKCHAAGITQSYLVEVGNGIPLMFSYLPPRGRFYRIMISGNALLIPADSTNKKFKLKLLPGNSTFLVTAGESIPELDYYTKIINSYPADVLLSTTQNQWNEFSAVHQQATTRISDPKLRNAIDDISVLIKSQQGVSGGIVAGHAYHMGYVRDQYGVSRGLLAMGHIEEAKKILEFYFLNWQEDGYIKNAQAIGYPHIFHRHENDEVEITGYLVLQATDYYRKTNDLSFILKIMPMLEWAITSQKRNLVDFMLPFNGDETYIAGGILPRKVMCNGSAEATLLFIEGTNRLLSYIRENKLWEQSKITDLDTVVQNCRSHYRENFFKNGILNTNNPERELSIQYPPSRFGVCLHPDHGGYSYEAFHFKGPLYFCKDCMAKDNSNVVIPEPEIFNIVSVSLFPFYINTELFTIKEKTQLLERVVKYYRENGRISGKKIILGSDYGFFLDGLVDLDHELKDEVYLKLMNFRDSTGAWVEYYENGVPLGCRCRPWESGINIEAAIRYQEKKRDNQCKM